METKKVVQPNIEFEYKGKMYDCEDFILLESVSSHLIFSLKTNCIIKGSNLWEHGYSQFLDSLGEQIIIYFKENINYTPKKIMAYIVDINICAKKGSGGYIIIKGGAATLLLDKSHSINSFTDKTLNAIIHSVLEKNNLNVELDIKPRYSNTISYLVQYYETDYMFLKRILSLYGENFYYSNNKIIIGPLISEAEHKLVYPIDIDELSVSSKLSVNKCFIYDYNYENNKLNYKTSVLDSSGKIEPLRSAQQGSNKNLNSVEKLLSARNISDINEIEHFMSMIEDSMFSNMNCVKFTTKEPIFNIGDNVNISIIDEISTNTNQNIGNLVIVKLDHKFINRKYSCVCSCVSASIADKCSKINLTRPKAGAEPAVVYSNDDPQKLGRVKVKFFWQDKNNDQESSNWIRVLSQDAGQSEFVKQNRGVFFIPDKGDQVMVAYKDADPSRPFVIGSLFYNGNTSGISGDNNTKSIISKTGLSIEFDDDLHGNWGIVIKDAKGNVFNLDTINGIIAMSSPTAINLKAPQIILEAQDQMQLFCQKDSFIKTGGSLNIDVKDDYINNTKRNCVENIEGNSKLNIDGDFMVNIDKALNIDVNSNLNMDINGSTDIESKARIDIASKSKVNICKR